jgi:hypothetical protein
MIGVPPRTRAIVECSHQAFRHGALDPTLRCLKSERPTERKKRRVFPNGHQYPSRSTRLAGPVRDYAIDLNSAASEFSGRQYNRPLPRRHDIFLSPILGIQSALATPFTESVVSSAFETSVRVVELPYLVDTEWSVA